MENSDRTLPIGTTRDNNEMKIGWEKMKDNFLMFFLLVLLWALLNAPGDLIDDIVKDNDSKSAGLILLQILGFGYTMFLLPIFSYGIDMLFLNGIRDEKPEVKAVTIGFKNYTNIVLANLLKFGLVVIALIALVIPGIVVGCRLAFVSYLVMDKNLSPMDAVEESWRMTKGRGWTIFSLYFMAIFIFIAGLILFIVGLFPALMWVNSYFAVYYQKILNENESKEPEGVEVV